MHWQSALAHTVVPRPVVRAGARFHADGARRQAGDELIERVLTNLLDNAIRHTPRPPGGEICVRSQAERRQIWGVAFSVVKWSVFFRHGGALHALNVQAAPV